MGWPGGSVILQSFRGYRPNWLPHDAMAGLAVAAVAIPSAIAYPAIAGLPPQVGVYSSILPLLGYALLGPSRQLIVGPDAATMTVLAATLANVSANAPDERVAAAAAVALAVGVYCLFASWLRLGVVAAFLSKPILVGFISGVSISILVGQIGRLTGLRIESGGLVAPILELVRKAGSIHLLSLAVGMLAFGLLQILTALRSPVPGPLVVVVLAVIVSAIFGLEQRGVAVVGSLPNALPALGLPDMSHLSLPEVALDAAAVWLVSFGSGIVTARSFGARGKFEVDADAELIGFGGANLASGLFGGFPVTVSDSRTAINLAVGGRSQATGIVAALALAATLLYLNEALRVLPTPALGAILVAAAISLVDVASLREIWRISRVEFVFALIGMAGPISLGVLRGVVIAIGATLLYVLLQEMRPHDAMLGVIPGRRGFYKLHRFKEARPIPGLTLFLLQGSLLFFNVDYLKARFTTIARELPADARWFVLDAGAIAQLDSTAAAMLEDVRALFAEKGVVLGIAELHKGPRDILERAGVLDHIGAAMIFEDLEEAATAFYRLTPNGAPHSPPLP
ncbi:SulP family inorganic anion transporter [Methylocella silvestris]|uniref:SulP family inorganic anion transporter n=1 Tax=Methylocella silvestris TaxID=199596 RepID=UPI00059C7847|nr:SulP family inorganic anion transporter [Methylocella silvestris]